MGGALSSELDHSPPNDSTDQRRQQHDPQNFDPERLPQVGLGREGQADTGLVPHPVVICGPHVENVFPRIEIVVLGCAPGADVLPIAVRRLELDLEAQFLGGAEIEGSVMDLESAAAGRQDQPLGKGAFEP